MHALILGACCVWALGPLCRTGGDVHGPVVWSLSHTGGGDDVQTPGKKWFWERFSSGSLATIAAQVFRPLTA